MVSSIANLRAASRSFAQKIFSQFAQRDRLVFASADNSTHRLAPERDLALLLLLAASLPAHAPCDSDSHAMVVVHALDVVVRRVFVEVLPLPCEPMEFLRLILRIGRHADAVGLQTRGKRTALLKELCAVFCPLMADVGERLSARDGCGHAGVDLVDVRHAVK